ncbi:MAG: hypothetical protein GTO22_05345 [Gemmatimonadales bacterium]|nr:hypothetical protein [Gemmatimonadales bacterium]
MKRTAWITIVAGLWLALTGILRLSHLGYLSNDSIVGLIVMVSGFGLARSRPWQGTLAGLLGIWMFVAAFIHGLQGGAAALWNHLITGAVIAAAGFSGRR